MRRELEESLVRKEELMEKKGEALIGSTVRKEMLIQWRGLAIPYQSAPSLSQTSRLTKGRVCIALLMSFGMKIPR